MTFFTQNLVILIIFFLIFTINIAKKGQNKKVGAKLFNFVRKIQMFCIVNNITII